MRLTIDLLDIRQCFVSEKDTNQPIQSYLISNEFCIKDDTKGNVYYDISNCGVYDTIVLDPQNVFVRLLSSPLTSIYYDINTQNMDLEKLKFRVIQPLNEMDLSQIEYDKQLYHCSHS